MKSKRIRVATAVMTVVAALAISAAPAQASGCSGKLTEFCQELENLVCYLTRRCF